MLKLPSGRVANALGFLACALMIAYALYAQYGLGLDPCPLCTFQRIAIIALGVVFLVATLHNAKSFFRYAYAILIVAIALIGIGVAVRHLRIQAQP
ncbi:MAG TPA: disulfide bond formation protein B, partial [Steroidobacteraceae bacterium]|nr:disulfide bond formation protein B [Steroidobacteraceae bacterium]